MNIMPGVALAVVCTAAVAVGGGSPRTAPANGASYADGVSNDGRFVLVTTDATNLVAGDTNRVQDVYVRDLRRRTTERISLGRGLKQPHDHVFGCGISSDGRYVAFESEASVFVPHDTNGASDVFVRDRRTGRTERVSVSTNGAQGNDLGTAGCAMSADGRYVAFTSYSSNLVPGDTNQRGDVFVRDRLLGTTERVSVSSTGEQGNDTSGHPDIAISDDGRFVAFTSDASNLVGPATPTEDDTFGVFIHDRVSGATEKIPGAGSLGDFNADGRYISITAAAPDQPTQTFLYDRVTAATELVSVSPDGAAGNDESGPGSVSADGRYVAFTSRASNLGASDTNDDYDIFVRDRANGVTAQVTHMKLGAVGGLLSRDGRFVLYQAPWRCGTRKSCFGNVYERDLALGKTVLVSVGGRFTKKAS
jgi:Tol biopolymer transport system component